MLNIITKELNAELWLQVEILFGSNGACGGCWCQAWRIEKGERWNEVKGAVAKERLRNGVISCSVHGILAFDGAKPVGWCTFGPRDSFPRLNRARSLSCDDSHRVWSIPCFFVLRAYRGRGVARKMLDYALQAIQNRGVEIVEGYPAKPDGNGRTIAAFSWTGTKSLFEKEGFEVAGNPNGAKQCVRKSLTIPLKKPNQSGDIT